MARKDYMDGCVSADRNLETVKLFRQRKRAKNKRKSRGKSTGKEWYQRKLSLECFRSLLDCHGSKPTKSGGDAKKCRKKIRCRPDRKSGSQAAQVRDRRRTKKEQNMRNKRQPLLCETRPKGGCYYAFCFVHKKDCFAVEVKRGRYGCGSGPNAVSGTAGCQGRMG